MLPSGLPYRQVGIRQSKLGLTSWRRSDGARREQPLVGAGLLLCALAWYIQKAAVLTDACCPAWSYNTCKTLLLSSSRLATTLLSLLYYYYCCLASLITATSTGVGRDGSGLRSLFWPALLLARVSILTYYSGGLRSTTTTLRPRTTPPPSPIRPPSSTGSARSISRPRSEFPVVFQCPIWIEVFCAWCRRGVDDQEIVNITYFSVVKQKTTTTKNFVKSKHEDRNYWGHWPS